jgi:hypothetical protein
LRTLQLGLLLWFLLSAAQAQAQTAGSLPESQQSTIGYPSVVAALKDLQSKPGVTFNTQNGWLIAEDTANLTIWSFAPKEHPAYPSVVKRSFVTTDGVTAMDMKVRCEAAKLSCDKLVIEFQHLNERTRAALQTKPK